MPARQNHSDDLAHIKAILQDHPAGLTVTEIAKALSKTKNTVGRYLDVLHASGQIEMRSIGMAKVCTLSRRVPLAQLIRHAPEMVIILDNDLRILQANDPFLRFLSITIEEVTGRILSNIPCRKAGLQQFPSSLVAAINSGESDTNLHIDEEDEYYLKVRTIPTVFEDGGRGYTVIIINLTATKRAEKALRQNEQKYRELVEYANSVILKMDREGNITFFNEFAEHFFGFTKEEVLGKNVIGTIVPPTESSGRDLRDLIHRICSGASEYQNNENENITRDGRRVWIRWTNRAILDAEGKPVGILSIGIDSTEKREMEDLLRKQAWELGERVKELRCLYSISEMTEQGESIEEVLQGVVDLLPGAFQHPVFTAVRLNMGDHVFSTSNYQETPWVLQSEIRIGNRLVGSLKVSYLDKHPNTGKEPFLHEEKDLVGIVASRLSRVIAHRELEIALQRERDFSSTILSTLDSLVVVLDREGRIATFNRACESLTGYLETEVKGRFFEEMLLLAEEVEKVRTVHEALLAGHAPLRFRSHWRTRRGDIRLIEWSNTVLRDSSGMITHVIGTGIDVTDLRKMV